MARFLCRQLSFGRTCKRHPLASLLQRWPESCHQALQSWTTNFPTCLFTMSDAGSKPSSLHVGAPASWAACTCACPLLARLVKGILYPACYSVGPNLATRPSSLGLPTFQLVISPYLMMSPSPGTTRPHHPHGQLVLAPAQIWPRRSEASTGFLVNAIDRNLPQGPCRTFPRGQLHLC
jgi:hypothetical protein